MIIYLGLIAITLFCAFYVQDLVTAKKVKLKYEFTNRNFLGVFVIITIFLILIVGLRADTVGIDTLNYKETYLRCKNYNFDYLKTKKITDEIGYWWLMIAFNKLNIPWNVYATFMAAVYIIPVMIAAYKKSENVFWCIIVFVLGGSWIFAFSTMRQAFAIGITVIAFMLEEKKKNILCILLILLASLFHISALAALLYFVVLKIKLTKNNAPIWALIGVLCATTFLTALRSFIMEAMDSIDRGTRETETGGWLTEVFFVASLLICYFLTDVFDEKNLDDLRYVKAIFLVAVMLPIIRINPVMFRVYFYFSIYGVIFIPVLISRIRDNNTKPFAFIGYGITYIYMFITSLNTTRLTDYTFFWR